MAGRGTGRGGRGRARPLVSLADMTRQAEEDARSQAELQSSERESEAGDLAESVRSVSIMSITDSGSIAGGGASYVSGMTTPSDAPTLVSVATSRSSVLDMGLDVDVGSTLPSVSRSESVVAVERPARTLPGVVATPVTMNYFHMNRNKKFQLFSYRVDFDPVEDNTRVKRKLMDPLKKILGEFMFDGHTLYSGRNHPPQQFKSQLTPNDPEYEISMRQVSIVDPDDKIYLQFYNIALRSALETIGMEQIGRHYYNRAAEINMPNDKLSLWPGFITAIREHSEGILLCVEVTHKVLRKETALDITKVIREQMGPRGAPEQAQRERIATALKDSIVITHYNRKTYRVDEIDFESTPASEFRKSDGTLQSYAKYFLERYNLQVTDMSQPMIVTYPRRKDINKGVEEPIYLVPELCYMTGLTDDMRKNFQLMKRLSVHLHMSPDDRKRKLTEFIQKFQTIKIREMFERWHFDFSTEFVTGTSYILPKQEVQLRTNDSSLKLYPDTACDWTVHFRNAGLLEPVTISTWLFFVPLDLTDREVTELVQTMDRVGRKLGVIFEESPIIIKYDSRGTFKKDIFMREVNKYKNKFEFVFYILPNNALPRYAAVKRACTLDLQVVSQCFQSKHIRSPKNLNSICQKMLIQVNAKMKGQPWAVHIPLPKMMVLGFDVYHCPDRKNESVGALVGTINKKCNRYFSTTSFHKDKSELSTHLSIDIIKTLKQYEIANAGELPTTIFLFRDGVGEGQIEYVKTHELQQIQDGIRRFYRSKNRTDDVKLAFIIVTKKINTRFLTEAPGNRWTSPPPGSVLDSVVTLPERVEFFLVSQTVRQGTVSPTNYHVVHDTTGLSEEKLQLLTYKLCHLYFNWSGTVAVPAPCQYAHKLAYITGMALADDCPESLSTNLWYL